MVALFEGGVHGNFSAPIVRDVIKAYFDKKARMNPTQPALARLTPPLLEQPQEATR